MRLKKKKKEEKLYLPTYHLEAESSFKRERETNRKFAFRLASTFVVSDLLLPCVQKFIIEH